MCSLQRSGRSSPVSGSSPGIIHSADRHLLLRTVKSDVLYVLQAEIYTDSSNNSADKLNHGNSGRAMSQDKRMSSDLFTSVPTNTCIPPVYERLTAPCNDFSAPNWFQSPPFAEDFLY